MSTIQIPTPLAAHGLLYISSGYPADPLRPVYAIRPGASGDISLKPGETSNASIAWSQPTLGAYNPSALVYGDYYYTLIDRGLLTCHDAKTGKEIYPRQRITADAASFTASPWAYNGKIFAMSEDGDTYVLQAGPGIQGARQELAERDDAGDAGDRQRQPHRPHGVEAVSDRQERQSRGRQAEQVEPDPARPT